MGYEWYGVIGYIWACCRRNGILPAVQQASAVLNLQHIKHLGPPKLETTKRNTR